MEKAIEMAHSSLDYYRKLYKRSNGTDNSGLHLLCLVIGVTLASLCFIELVAIWIEQFYNRTVINQTPTTLIIFNVLFALILGPLETWIEKLFKRNVLDEGVDVNFANK